ncbi:MAG: UDP-glucose/GDP-mannose dehydrogenase family protein [Candidatus Niyogibacteria bacterium]|nr:UDP-glucose/GDP-mannose dehydrogenase family protein [Candidatus Niyogibacteria bacterium]
MKRKPMVGVAGIGMVGAPLAKYFLSAGFKRGKNLFLFDADPKKKFRDDISRSDILFICVPSPSKPDGSCDVSIVEAVVAKYASPERIFVIKTTVEPATCERLSHTYRCPIVLNPEFLREASAWEDMAHPDRQIAGHTVNAEDHAVRVAALLPRAPFVSPARSGLHQAAITASEAELGKYAANTFGALKVVFGNIIADCCRALEYALKKENVPVGISYDRVRNVFASDHRIGDAWLDVNHGDYRGYGGYCFPKDVNALLAFAKRLGRVLPARSRERMLLASGLKVLDAMRAYNRALLKSQGLTEEMVSRHDAELKKKFKARPRARH